MTLHEAMAELERCSSEQGRKTWARHGTPAPLFGVRYADLYRIQKRIGRDMGLARALWITGNHDARVLATLIAEPAELSRAELDSWVGEASYRILNDAVASLAAKSGHARALADAWRRDGSEWTSAAGWNVVGGAAAQGADEAWLRACLEEIPRAIRAAPNYTRHCMNNALIAIGGCCPALTARALEAARAIGKVDVDHGDTSCKTPDAAPYIRKMLAHRAKKAATAKRKAPARKKTAARSGTRKAARKTSAAARRPARRKAGTARKKAPRARRR
jgi:3-methyladenine DNA glycosylase AlkD